MSRVRLSTIPSHDVASHNSEKSCYVTIGANVYDITSFLPDHPGGSDLILDYGGKDVSEIMRDELSHSHSRVAYETLYENLIGFVANEVTTKAVVEHDRPEDIIPLLPNKAGIKAMKANNTIGEIYSRRPFFAATGLSGPEDLSKETDLNADFKVHKFLDLSRPLLMQVWNGNFTKEFYLEQVHRPRHYYTKRGDSAPLFDNALESLTRTPWWFPLVIWLPLTVWGTILASHGMPSRTMAASFWMIGLGLWTLIEYGVHRGLFHADKYLPDNRVAISIHFLAHGLHHYLPMDKYRTVTPPSIAILLGAPLYKLVHSVIYWDWYTATIVFCGISFGYICYELTHYFFHHKPLPKYYESLKKRHLQHHYADYENGFGVTTQFWDRVFGTELQSVRKHGI